MLEIHKQTNKPISIIRAATGSELSDYEKQKLASIEDGAQKNKIESINLNGNVLPVDSKTKEVHIELGNLAFKSKVTSEDFNPDELIFIKCELDDTELF
mgnify:CR=1 FL=1